MDRNMFARYANDLKQFGSSGVGKPEFELERRGKYLLQYIPFEYVNIEAKIVIVGITPGPNQLALAYETAQKLLRTGRKESDILVEIKKAGAFGSASMRPNLLKMLRHFGFAKILGIEDVESLWDKNACLLHSTSVIPHAAFTLSTSGNKMFAGSFDEIMKSDLFEECFIDCFVPSIREINPNAFYVGLGPCPQSALQWCIQRDYIRPEQVLGAFCHPATTGGSTTKYYLREVTKEDLDPKDPVLNRCDWLDSAYFQMKESTSLLTGEEHPTQIVTSKKSIPFVESQSISSKESTKSVREKPRARVEATSIAANIEAVYSVFKKEGFNLTKETKKLAEFQSSNSRTIYMVKTTSNMNAINVMVHPELNLEELRRLDGVSSVSNEHRFHSNMSLFPKRLNKGQTETAYGWQVGIKTLDGLARFLTAIK
jgi:hypothetical protein